MNVLGLNKQLTHYCGVLRTAARKLYRTGGASVPRDEVLNQLEQALVRDGAQYSVGLWLPDKVGNISMNCGLLVDFVIEEKIAVLVDACDGGSRHLEDEARRCFARYDFSGAILLQLGASPVCNRLTRHATSGTGSALKTTRPHFVV